MTHSRGARALLVAAVLIAAFAIRIEYVDHTSYHAINDAGTYNRLASGIALTGDYDVGDGLHTAAGGAHGRTAYFPPGFPYFLAAADLIDGHQKGGKTAVKPERVEQSITGTVAVGLVGLVALEAFGSGVGLIAMVLAACYPVMVILSGTLVAENLLIAFELAATWTALRATRSAHLFWWIAATGVLTGLATLTHENGIVFLIPFSFAAGMAAAGTAGGGRREARRAWDRSGPEPAAESAAAPESAGVQPALLASRPASDRVRQTRWWRWRRKRPPRVKGHPVDRRAILIRATLGLALLLVTTALTIAPWTIRNAVELHHFIPVSDETGITLVGTYNPNSAAFKPVPYKWRFFFKIPQDASLVSHAGRYSEVALGARLESQALHYIGAHPLSPLDVALHNALRMFEIEGSFAWHASAAAIGLRTATAAVGIVGFWIVCVLAVISIAIRAARGGPRWIWWIPVLYALSIVFVNVETPRFREPIDPFLLLLAACGLERGLRTVVLRLRGAPIRRRRRAPRLAGHT